MDENTLDRKVVILGSTDVGKTSITMRYCHNSFTTPTSATIGASFLQKRVDIGNTKMTLQIWDTAGQERFRSMAPMYYRNAKAAVLVFDVTKEKSFTKVKEWLSDLRQHVDSDIVLAVVGNKCDCDAAFDLQMAKDFAKEINGKFHCTSAKSGTGVNELFEELSKDLLVNYREEERVNMQQRMHDDGSSFSLRDIDLDEPPAQTKKCC